MVNAEHKGNLSGKTNRQVVRKKAKRAVLNQSAVIRDASNQALGVEKERPELEDWRELRGFFEERAALTPKRQGRRWKREDLYEERMARGRDA